ncbi:MAG: hypothetical protein IKA72_04465 [Clostridia bacterium]|nr:hypothetical protein [Clostridia bacterium]
MPTIKLQGTEFSFSVLPQDKTGDKFLVKTKLAVKNAVIDYEEISERLSFSEAEEFTCLMARLLAGAFSKEYSFNVERPGFAVDFYPFEKEGEKMDRARLRKEDCVMAIRILFKDKAGQLLSGVYTLLLHRAEIKSFLQGFEAELNAHYRSSALKKGKYLFAGVSPLGYHGCKYWYLDPTKSCKTGEYVWVQMGRHNTEQIVYVDEARYFNDDNAPYDPSRVKQVLRKATEKEIRLLRDCE